METNWQTCGSHDQLTAAGSRMKHVLPTNYHVAHDSLGWQPVLLHNSLGEF